MGNAVTDDYNDYVGTFEYWWTHGLISDTMYHELKAKCNYESSEHPSAECVRALNVASEEQGNIDPYSVYTRPCNNTSIMKRNLKGHYVRFSISPDSNSVVVVMFFVEVLLLLSLGCQELTIPARIDMLRFTTTALKFRRLCMPTLPELVIHGILAGSFSSIRMHLLLDVQENFLSKIYWL